MVEISVEKGGSNHCEALTRAIGSLGEADLTSQDRVLNNANIVEPVFHTTGSVTNPNLVDAIIRWFESLGVREIVLGEDPSYYISEDRLLRSLSQTGYKELIGDCVKGTSPKAILIEGCPPDKGEITRKVKKYFL
ncbi:MAG: DUF362 domain-containing protein [Proteobacteria bacterium]|nr:DUF362 domain-containing protein [Pseudomonadota bacterium]